VKHSQGRVTAFSVYLAHFSGVICWYRRSDAFFPVIASHMPLILINWSPFLSLAFVEAEKSCYSPPEICDNQQPPLAGFAKVSDSTLLIYHFFSPHVLK